MYKLLIVEDEEIIRWGLRNEISWNSFGFEVVGEAENGNEALEKISKLNPDVVIVDIRMPVMDGIELMSRIHEMAPRIKTVVLSGYSDFEYARKSIEYGAFSYILKPTKEDEIKKVFERLKNELDSINKASHSRSALFPANPGNDARAEESDPVVQKIIKYIYEHYNERITLELLADMAYMNPSYFSVFFKQKTGYNYKDFLTALRIEKAKELLACTNFKVYEIASMVGYDDFRYFCRLFKNITGMNTLQFRIHQLNTNCLKEKQICALPGNSHKNTTS